MQSTLQALPIVLLFFPFVCLPRLAPILNNWLHHDMVYILKRLQKEMLLAQLCIPNWFFKTLPQNFSGFLLQYPHMSYFIVKYFFKKFSSHSYLASCNKKRKVREVSKSVKTGLLRYVATQSDEPYMKENFVRWRILFFPSLLSRIRTLCFRTFVSFSAETKQLSRLHICLRISTSIPHLHNAFFPHIKSSFTSQL